MPYRIFDSVLGNHSWSADGRLWIAQPQEPVSLQDASPETEVDAIFARLLHRSKLDRIVYRAAIQLHAAPSTPLNQLAADLGVTESYLVSGLRAALSVDPQDFLQRARAR
jgi:hypothetical protein